MPEKKSLKQQAYDEIKRKIVTCEYAPNTLLNEELLREELHVSRTPIRDALSRLEQKGLITILPKKGIMVSSLSINDINMVFEVRMMYEPYALLHYGSRIPMSCSLTWMPCPKIGPFFRQMTLFMPLLSKPSETVFCFRPTSGSKIRTCVSAS